MEIQYKTGDATRPDETPAVIIHVCNNVGAWGAGFVIALSNRDKTPQYGYQSWARNGFEDYGMRFELGAVQFTEFGQDGNVVANMVAQDNTKRDGTPPIDYEALEECLQSVSLFARNMNLPVVGPKFGAGIAGGDWNIIEQLIIKNLINDDIPVTIYTLP